MSVEILTGDALTELAKLPDESVQCVVTSPPYWGLRSYGGGPGMIGLEPTLEEHIENLVAVFSEVRRVLRSDGTCWVNYGDAYARGENRGSGHAWGGKQATHDGSAQATGAPLCGLKPKDLMMMPARVALALQADGAADLKAMRAISRVRDELVDAYDGGPLPDKVLTVMERMEGEYAAAKGNAWWVRSEIVWHKNNPMPESCTDRPTSSHEKVFLLSKASRYFYDNEAVRTDAGDWHGGRFNRHGHERHHHEHRTVPLEEQTSTANLRNVWTAEEDEYQQFLRWKAEHTGDLSDVWKLATYSFPGSHFATFPPALVEPCIKAGTSEKGCCVACGGAV